MYLLGNVLLGLAAVLDTVLFLFTIFIIASAVISWVNADPYNQLVRIIRAATEPVFSIIRRRIPTTIGALDLTPIVALLIIQFADIAIVRSIQMFAATLIAGN